jgi:hypothetical protein
VHKCKPKRRVLGHVCTAGEEGNGKNQNMERLHIRLYGTGMISGVDGWATRATLCLDGCWFFHLLLVDI